MEKINFRKHIRGDIISRLINDDIDSIFNGNGSYLGDILRDGFCGYNKYTDKQLLQELKERDIENWLNQ